MSRATRPRRRGAGHARRPHRPLRLHLGRLPGRGRLLALLVFAALVAGSVTLVNGPWLRISSVAHAGARFTPAAELEGIMAPYRGTPLLALDADALQEQVAALPAVASVRVEATLPGSLRVSVTEKAPAFVWRTPRAQLVTAADGSVMAALPAGGSLPAELRGLPVVDDTRYTSHGLMPGRTLPAADLRVASRLVGLDPRVIGSKARRLSVSLDDQNGFVLTSPLPGWEAALGFYERDPTEDRAKADARLEEQLAAIRTLFAQRSEWGVSWLDARNPGKVYWLP